MAPGLLLASCHPPTAKDFYPEARRCYAVLDSALKIIPPDRFRQANMDPDLLVGASQIEMQSAFSNGKEIGMTPDAVFKDLDAAKRAYLRSHTRTAAGGADAISGDLRDDVNACLDSFYGRPND